MQFSKTLTRASTLCICAIFLMVVSSFAQTSEKLKLKPTDGEVSSSIRKQTYFYPDFKEGKVFLANGVTSISTLNYNLLSGEVEFINSKKDTLALADVRYVNFMVIGTDTFYYTPEDKALLRLVAQYDDIKLLVNERYDLTDIKTVGAYGIESSTASPTSASRNQSLGNTQNRLKQNETMVYSLKASFFLLDKGRFIPANKSSILKLASKNRDVVKSYIKVNNTDFKNEEELKKLLAYVSSL